MRLLLRSIGYLLIAGGFIAGVIDGARSIANGALRFATLEDLLSLLLHERYRLIGPAIGQALHPWLADPVWMRLTQVPAAGLALLLGFGLLFLAREPEPPIGIVTRR